MKIGDSNINNAKITKMLISRSLVKEIGIKIRDFQDFLSKLELIS